MQVHVASGHYLNEVDAHAGRRIWSVCHSKLRHHFAVTASDDCTARLWSGSGLNTHVATVTAPGKPAICCADFSSSNEYLLALAAADAKVYLYDMRQLQQPIMTLHGHRRPVSYAKFFGSQQLVSASIDGTLAVWDLGQLAGAASELVSAVSVAVDAAAGNASLGPSPASSTCCSSDGSCWQQQEQQQAVGSAAAEGRCSSARASGCCTESLPTAGAAAEPSQHQQQQQPWKVFQGHRNEKNFVGLSVDPCSGLMAVGSETSEVFSYHTSWSSPLARYDMAQQQQGAPSGLQQQMQQGVAASWSPPGAIAQQQSVSAVAWQPSCAAAALQGYCQGGGVFAPSTLLAAAGSTGVCRLLSLQHP
jgi:E3 ubiquitin-protein ligase RFWD2